MAKKDDSSLTPAQYARIRAEARRALEQAGTFGHFPTNIDAVLLAANVQEVKEDVLSQGFLATIRKKAGAAIKSALSKVLGLFDVRGGLVFIDRSLQVVKQTFIRLHEAGHGFLPWQRPLYALVEDCEQSLDPEVADLFDREANVFASEVLFQLDAFSQEAESHPFGILTPVNLSKKYGASIYASIRQYVSKNRRICAVLVLNPPELLPGDGFRASLRRIVTSEEFKARFGGYKWRSWFTPADPVGAMIPVGKRRASGKRGIELIDDNGTPNDCVAEAFTQGHQVFVLIHVVCALSSASIVRP